ncbi:transposase [Komagataeibacter europaeus]|uniref:transposase n=1 Tax=Komagataeibacter europaeus TaxID=33995 RepID=UPI000237EF3F
MRHISRRTGHRRPCSKKGFSRHIGRTKGGLNSKLHAVCDGQGRPVRLHLTAGQVSDFKGADVLLADLSDGTEEVIGDRGHDSNRIRLSRAKRNITACIPLKRNGNQSRLTTGICMKSAI